MIYYLLFLMDKNPNTINWDGSTLKVFENYSIDQAKELLDVFTSHLHEDIKIWTSKQLIKALEDEWYHLFLNEIENNINNPEFINDLTHNPKQLEAILLYCYNRNFRNTHIKDWNKLKDLRIHKPWDVRQEWMDIWKWKHFWKLEKWITKYWRKLNSFSKNHLWIWIQDAIDKYYQPHLLEMTPEEEKLIEDIILWLEKWEKNFIILNHDTFANIPLAIVKFMKKAEKLWVKDVNKYFTTIIWPLLNVHSVQNTIINTLSNVVITHPAGNKIPEAKPLVNLQQKWALNQIIKDLGKDWWGQVYFCSPSGTRDVVIYWKDEKWETIPHIYIPDESWWSNVSTIKLVNRLKKNNPELKIYSFSTNTTELKKDISLTDNSWNKWADISMHISDLNQDEPLTPEDIVKCLAKWVTYPIKWDNWEIIWEQQCATAIPEELFKKLKKWNKTWEYPEWLIKENWQIDVYVLNDLIKNCEYYIK